GDARRLLGLGRGDQAHEVNGGFFGDYLDGVPGYVGTPEQRGLDPGGDRGVGDRRAQGRAARDDQLVVHLDHVLDPANELGGAVLDALVLDLAGQQHPPVETGDRNAAALQLVGAQRVVGLELDALVLGLRTDGTTVDRGETSH